MPVISFPACCSCSIAVMFDRVMRSSATKPFSIDPFGDFVDRFLGDVEHVRRLARRVERRAHDGVAHHDQPPQRRLLLDDVRVALDVGDVRNAVDERRDVRRSADLLELGVLGQLLAQRQQIDLAALLRQPPHRREDRPMRVAKKVLGADRADHAVERMVVDQNRSEDRALRIRRLRQRPVESDVELRYGHWMKCAESRSDFVTTRECSQPSPQTLHMISSGDSRVRGCGKVKILLDRERDFYRL